MNISFGEVKEILDTLPIGLYVGRRVPCQLEKDIETSYYSPANDTITISYDIIVQGLTNVTPNKDYDEETAIRSMLYHEVSHAILTPPDLMNCCSSEYAKIINIFEDERIETILGKYYLDVNFKRQLLEINGGSIPTPDMNNPDLLFYLLVRFNIGEPSLLKRKNGILERYDNITRNTQCGVYNYVREVKLLYDALCSSSKYSNPNELGINEEGLSEGLKNLMQDIEIIDNSQPQISKEIQEVEENSREETSKAGGESGIEIFDTVLNHNMDTEVFNKVSTIVSQFNKKNRGGNGFTAYSGIFNPRLVGNENYRYFDRSTTVNGTNSFGTFHLNLMLDDSGSFSCNEEETNKVIQALIEVEKRYKNFTFDVYFVAERYRKAETNEERYVNAIYGNCLTPKLFELVRKAQKPMTVNYNIVMYDGRAWNGANEKKNFAAFNRNNCTIIAEKSNKEPLEEYCPSANIIISDDYVNEISKNVILAIEKAFR